MSNICAVIMASGKSERFGENKLLKDINGTAIIERVLKAFDSPLINKVVVVAKEEEVLRLAKKYGCIGVKNQDETFDPAITIRLGVTEGKEAEGVILSVADQPLLTKESVERLVCAFIKDKENIYGLGQEKEMYNPVIFPKKYFSELLSLTPFKRGKEVVKKHKENAVIIQADERELFDIDYKEDLKKI